LGGAGSRTSDFATTNAASADPNPLDFFTDDGLQTLYVRVILRAGFDVGVRHFVATDLLFRTIKALCHKRSVGKNMTAEGKIDNTPAPKPTTKKRIFKYVQWILVVLIFVIPFYSIKKYRELLVSTPVAAENAQADCGVVLTGGAGRIREGITLLSHHQVQKLIISGVHQRSNLTEMFPEILFYPEVKLENVILERRSSSTAGNAQATLPIAEALNCQSILLITSDYHMFRALKTFLQAFPGSMRITPFAVPSDRLRLRKARFIDTHYWGTVVEEWSKFIFYEVFVF
jgi:uncharacterized SAM-binding protein YcdF (DUF218 family)